MLLCGRRSAGGGMPPVTVGRHACLHQWQRFSLADILQQPGLPQGMVDPARLGSSLLPAEPAPFFSLAPCPTSLRLSVQLQLDAPLHGFFVFNCSIIRADTAATTQTRPKAGHLLSGLTCNAVLHTRVYRDLPCASLIDEWRASELPPVWLSVQYQQTAMLAATQRGGAGAARG